MGLMVSVQGLPSCSSDSSSQFSFDTSFTFFGSLVPRCQEWYVPMLLIAQRPIYIAEDLMRLPFIGSSFSDSLFAALFFSLLFLLSPHIFYLIVFNEIHLEPAIFKTQRNVHLALRWMSYHNWMVRQIQEM